MAAKLGTGAPPNGPRSARDGTETPPFSFVVALWVFFDRRMAGLALADLLPIESFSTAPRALVKLREKESLPLRRRLCIAGTAVSVLERPLPVPPCGITAV